MRKWKQQFEKIDEYRITSLSAVCEKCGKTVIGFADITKGSIEKDEQKSSFTCSDCLEDDEEEEIYELFKK